MSFGSNGSGTSLHLGAEQLKMLAGLNATHVPYRGTPQVLADLIAGRVDWMFGNLARIMHQGWRAWRKPLIGHRIRLRDLNLADVGAHARQA